MNSRIHADDYSKKTYSIPKLLQRLLKNNEQARVRALSNILLPFVKVELHQIIISPSRT